jgi:hypothetical protein
MDGINMAEMEAGPPHQAQNRQQLLQRLPTLRRQSHLRAHPRRKFQVPHSPGAGAIPRPVNGEAATAAVAGLLEALTALAGVAADSGVVVEVEEVVGVLEEEGGEGEAIIYEL